MNSFYKIDPPGDITVTAENIASLMELYDKQLLTTRQVEVPPVIMEKNKGCLPGLLVDLKIPVALSEIVARLNKITDRNNLPVIHMLAIPDISEIYAYAT